VRFINAGVVHTSTLSGHTLGRTSVKQVAFINNLIYRALARDDTPAVKEPKGLVRNDGKRPDGLTLVSWLSGCCAIWGVTVVDTLAVSYVSQLYISAASVAEVAVDRKIAKYSALNQSHHFFPKDIETLGPMSEDSQDSIKEIGRRTTLQTSDPRETAYLFQRISIALQRFNSLCLTNTFTAADQPSSVMVNTGFRQLT
jgi:hypothetical protein